MLPPLYVTAAFERPNVELSGRRRRDARPGLMYRVPPDRAWWAAGGAPLERRVRQAVPGRLVGDKTHGRIRANVGNGLRRLHAERSNEPALQCPAAQPRW